MVPGKNGGTYLVYNKVLRPFVIKHQDQIDKSLGQAREAVGKGMYLYKPRLAAFYSNETLI
jgi:hypothetical protein